MLRGAGSDLPILVLEGSSELVTASEPLPKGVSKLMNKPVTIEKLSSAIAELLPDSEVP
jgi:CheY-like chemotaxis protein